MTTTKDVKTTLTNCLRELRLPAFREHYEGMAQRATQETLTTAAAIDRLVHHSVILELNISSYRLEQAKRSQTGEPAAEPPAAEPAAG